MSVSMSAWGLIAFPAIFLFLLKWPRAHYGIEENSRVSLIRRVAAFFVDMFVATMGVMPIATMPALIAEYFATGEWQWSFERDYVRNTDWILFLSMLCALCGAFYYFKWHFDHQRQTVGQHMMKFMLVPMHDHPRIWVRFLVAWACAAWWPFWPWTIFKQRQDYFWDTASGTKARRVSPP